MHFRRLGRPAFSTVPMAFALAIGGAVPSLSADPVDATWKMFRRGEHESRVPGDIPGDAKDVRVKHKWRSGDDFHWLIADLNIPEKIDGKPAKGRPVGITFNCAAGGDLFVDDALQARYDNDQEGLALISESAEPGKRVRLAAMVYANLGGEGDNEFHHADWVLLEPSRAREPLVLKVDAGRTLDPMPDGLIGLSQGGGMSDYDDATADKLRKAGFKWFRMDNVLTNAVKDDGKGGLAYDFSDLERRVSFMRKIGAEPILCASYMPQALDAIPDKDRHSAPKDYKLWEELCFRAARHLVERKMPVKWWEVWNETNAGWIKPGPNDTGTEEFAKLYEAALGKPAESKDDVRLLEAYMKLYAATVAGVRRADPGAMVGGPCLASAPFERTPETNYAVRGKVFARALMMYCRTHKLPLDFISWHEYWHPAELFVRETRTFRQYLDEFPDIRKNVRMFMLTEWNASWWPDRTQDHEMGAAWCADVMIRALLPERVDRPCFFYVKDNDSNLRGSWGLLIRDNVPKPVYHMAAMFNRMTGTRVALTGGDDEVCGLAAWDAKAKRLGVIVTNYRRGDGIPRKVRLAISSLPKELHGGRWQRTLVDPTHSNVWHDRSRAELETVDQGPIKDGRLELDLRLLTGSITMLEVTGVRE